jgi:hypothetical protein
MNHNNNINYIKTSITRSLLKTAFVIVSFTSGLTIAQPGGSDASHARTVRPGTQDYRIGSAEGYLLVYSATDESFDGDLAVYAHSSYSIYTADGKLFKNVENHMSQSDEIPELVTLPPGSYAVEARSTNNGYVRVRVMIKPGQRTTLDLDRGI